VPNSHRTISPKHAGSFDAWTHPRHDYGIVIRSNATFGADKSGAARLSGSEKFKKY